jgi:hypothetical protein
MERLATDVEVLALLRLKSPKPLRALVVDGGLAGIEPPFVSLERSRRWRTADCGLAAGGTRGGSVNITPGVPTD